MHRAKMLGLLIGLIVGSGTVRAADVVPPELEMPGTQPEDMVDSLKTPIVCGGCHNGGTIPLRHEWAGGMMAHASRDPMFWATLAVAEQDFDGAGDFCLRCHTPRGWLAGRSEPTDGVRLHDAAVGPLDADTNGVECDLCHRLTNPDGSEHLGVQNSPFIANKNGVGFYGSSQFVIWNQDLSGVGTSKLGPYSNAAAPHGFRKSLFHRSPDLCGTCHDVSNPLTGDLAPNNGAQVPLQAGTFSGVPGSAKESKAAFKNFPYQYGIAERTYSEHKASLFPTMLVADYDSLPSDLKNGAIKAAYDAATLGGTVEPNYALPDNAPRTFTCQTCHMSPARGSGCGGGPERTDLPRHDLTGGNYWMPDVIMYLDKPCAGPLCATDCASPSKLLLGSGVCADPNVITALTDGKTRARKTLGTPQAPSAASLSVTGNTLRVVNLTGHKLISGYPEGRRMWLNIKWYDAKDGNLLREDGAYGSITATIDGVSTQVNTILDLGGTNTRIYEAHGAITQEWAAKLIDTVKVPSDLPVTFDRTTGAVTSTLAQVAAGTPGSYRESFHFALNDYVSKDNRIPPYGMQYDEARKRNALPVPTNQYGNPGPGGEFHYFDEVVLNPPATAQFATIELRYQPTSWEYVQFLHRANTGQNPRLANEGKNLLEGWLKTGMAEPQTIASAEWRNIKCPQPQGFWKNNPSAWPVAALTLGSQAYTQAELLTLLRTAPGRQAPADASLILAHQLIAAKLNVANGSDPAPIAGTISDADALLSGFAGKLAYGVRPFSASGKAMVSDAGRLDSYNNGLATPGCAPSPT